MLPTQTGQKVEELIAATLQKKGLRLIEANFRCKVGEIDLIMKDKSHLVFVEVRYRKQADYGSGLESVHTAKQRKLIKTALLYLQWHPWAQQLPCRFDVVSASGPLENLAINWVPNAFTC